MPYICSCSKLTLNDGKTVFKGERISDEEFNSWPETVRRAHKNLGYVSRLIAEPPVNAGITIEETKKKKKTR